MSTDSHNNSHKIEEAMNSLDGIKRAQAPEFMYTRLQARMEAEFDQGGTLGRWLTRPVLALTIAAIVLIANATTVLKMWKQNTSGTGISESAQVAVADYPAGVYPVYNENSVEP